jgi:predicted RNA-binding Zn ribbon-like protein
MGVEPRAWPTLVGGHPVLDFVNTDIAAGPGSSTDVLRSAGEFVAWCAYARVPSASLATSDLVEAEEAAFLHRVRQLRAGLTAVIQAIADDRRPGAEALTTLQTAFVDAIGHATSVADDGHLTWRWTAATPRVPAWELAIAAIDLLRSAPTERIKACPACGFVFIDTTKNGSRRWCSMEDCGKREKIRRYVTKRAEQRSTR